MPYIQSGYNIQEGVAWLVIQEYWLGHNIIIMVHVHV